MSRGSCLNQSLRVVIGFGLCVGAVADFVSDPSAAHAGPRRPLLGSPESPNSGQCDPGEVLVCSPGGESCSCVPIGPTPTPTPPPKPTPTPRPRPTPKPTPTPPPPGTCKMYSLTGYFLSQGLSTNPLFIPTLKTPACVKQEIERAMKRCLPVTGITVDFDDCVVNSYFMHSGNTKHPKGPWKPNSMGNLGCATKQNPYCIGATWYLDENCKSVSKPTSQQVKNACDAGTLTGYASPISLILEPEHNLEADLKIVTFPLDPRKAGAFYSWKASEQAPLLVWDPSGEGAITSSFQLFGEWTFGGKSQVSSLESLVMNDITTQTAEGWSDGFEALGTLDLNNDGEVSGAELASLRLWFDTNRDGISQSGEVRSLESAGVTSLYYRGAVRNVATRNLQLERGFKRDQSGVVSFGEAIDWYAQAASTPAELVASHLAIPSACKAASVGSDAVAAESSMLLESAAVAEPSQPNVESKQSAPAASNLNGAWRWSLRGDSDPALWAGGAGGILVFKDFQDGEISGHSFVTAGLNAQAVGASTQLDIIPLTGSKELSVDGVELIAFRAVGQSGVTIYSSAELSADGKTLTGSSRAIIPSASQTISYPWVATRVE